MESTRHTPDGQVITPKTGESSPRGVDDSLAAPATVSGDTHQGPHPLEGLEVPDNISALSGGHSGQETPTDEQTEAEAKSGGWSFRKKLGAFAAATVAGVGVVAAAVGIGGNSQEADAAPKPRQSTTDAVNPGSGVEPGNQPTAVEAPNTSASNPANPNIVSSGEFMTEATPYSLESVDGAVINLSPAASKLVVIAENGTEVTEQDARNWYEKLSELAATPEFGIANYGTETMQSDPALLVQGFDALFAPSAANQLEEELAAFDQYSVTADTETIPLGGKLMAGYRVMASGMYDEGPSIALESLTPTDTPNTFEATTRYTGADGTQAEPQTETVTFTISKALDTNGNPAKTGAVQFDARQQ